MKGFIAFCLVLLVIACENSKPKTVYFKNDATGEVLSVADFEKMKVELEEKIRKTSASVSVSETITDSIISNDSIIKSYKLDVKLGEMVKEKEENVFSFVGNKLPSRMLYSIENQKVDFELPIDNKPTVLNFWFTACKPCIEEMPLLNKFREKYGDRINFIAITYNDAEEVKEFLKKNHFSYLHIIEAQTYLDELGVNNYPKNIFVDRNGIVKKVENGIPYKSKNGKLEMGDGEKMEDELKKLL